MKMSKRPTGSPLVCVVTLLVAVTLANADNQSKITATTVTTSRPNVKAILSVYEPSQQYQSNAYRSDGHRTTGNLIDQPAKSDVTYSEPDLIERRKSRIDLIQKDDRSSKQQLNLYKRPSQFGELLRNPDLLEKQQAAIGLANGRLNAKLLNDEPISEAAIRRRFEDERRSHSVASGQRQFNDQQPGQPNDRQSSERQSTSKTFSDQKQAEKALNDRLRHELNNQFSQALNYLIKYINRQGQTRSINGTEHTKRQNGLLLKHARNLDRENCLLRLVCEISSNQEDASDNQLIREIRIEFG